MNAKQDTANSRTVSCRYSLIAAAFAFLGTVWTLTGSTPKWVAPLAFAATGVSWMAHTHRNRRGEQR
ncbi:hypothetical protein ABZ569_32330 [Streptomyces albus]|uniref:hypothetical protein n=1 Tax=Streptomyces albus TaxID=1888 RepID=UPI00340C1217